MKTIKIIVRKYLTHEGKEFTSATIKGKFLPLALAEDEVYYKVRFVGDMCKLPTAEGMYEVAYEDKGMWIDNRPAMADKHILRIKAVKVVFAQNLKIDFDK